MAVTETIEFDLDLIDRLISDEEATLEPKHRASIEYRTVAERHVAGGVASSWQSSPPHAIYIDRGEGSHIWDLDGNEYVDFHLGYGAMVIGHAHPKVVEAIEKRARLGTHFAQPTAQLHEIGENVAERFGLPLWRFCNSGTEATLEAVRLMRANTGRDLIVKIEGTYHGHHDSLMFSVAPDPELIGAREHPVTVPQAMGIPQAFADLVRVVPFNDLAEAERAFAENEGRIAGMIVEPAMMNCGVVLPQPGYLQGLLDLCHRHGAYLAFDEVKTGATIAWGGAVEAFGVQPDIVTLAKAFGGGVPCGAVGATEELFGPVLRGDHDIAGTFNGNPLTMAAARATLLEVLTPDVYERLRAIDRALKDGIRPIIDRYRLPAYVTGIGAKGSVTYSSREVREYRDTIGIDERITYLAWLMQQNRGVFKSPWAKMETWTLSVVHSDEDVRRYVDNFEEFAAAVASLNKLSAVGERWDTVPLSDGRSLEVAVQGADEGVLLIFHHGSPGAAQPFEPFHRAAAERGIVLAFPSRAGFGESSRQEGRTVASAAADAVALADLLGHERFLTAGWSGGGPHALACAALLPDRVLAAATIAGVAPYDAEGLDWTAGMGEDNQVEYPLAARDPDELFDWMEEHAEAMASIEADQIVAEMGSLVSDVDAAQVTGEFGDSLAASFRSAFRHGRWGWFDDDLAFVRDWGFDLNDIRVPVSIWQGREDRMVPFAHGEWLIEHVPGARTRLRPEHGHLSLGVGAFGEILDDLLEASGDHP